MLEHLKKEIDYETAARASDPKDFQSQVLRTPRGRPVQQEQVDMIIESIVRCLNIASADIVLDLCCGNGAITDPILALCQGGVGVDRSDYLIEIAKENFERKADRLYYLSDVLEYLKTTEDTNRITKVMCYGAFQYLNEAKAAESLLVIRNRFPNVERFFIGNLPDLARADIFWREHFGTQSWGLHDLKRNDTHFGIWRTRHEFTQLAAACGWAVEISQMPSDYYGASFRYDATLSLFS
jgi:SAM-dependent methyltransferase